MKKRWLTNAVRGCYNPSTGFLFDDSEFKRYGSNNSCGTTTKTGLIVGPPKKSSKYSVQELQKKDMVGLYELVER